MGILALNPNLEFVQAAAKRDELYEATELERIGQIQNNQRLQKLLNDLAEALPLDIDPSDDQRVYLSERAQALLEELEIAGISFTTDNAPTIEDLANTEISKADLERYTTKVDNQFEWLGVLTKQLLAKSQADAGDRENIIALCRNLRSVIDRILENTAKGNK